MSQDIGDSSLVSGLVWGFAVADVADSGWWQWGCVDDDFAGFGVGDGDGGGGDRGGEPASDQVGAEVVDHAFDCDRSALADPASVLADLVGSGITWQSWLWGVDGSGTGIGGSATAVASHAACGVILPGSAW